MQYIDLITGLNNLADKDEVAVHFKSLRQDALIWEGLQKIEEQPGLVDSLSNQKMPLNPGSLAVLMFDPGFVFSDLNLKVTSSEKLENLMFGYENYIQSEEPVKTLEVAGLLALALMEKRKASTNWVGILQEIVSRMKITNGQIFRDLWGTILVIVINLIEDKEEFLRDLTIFQQPEASVAILNHLVLSLPWKDEEKAETLRRYLYPLSPQVQVAALKSLNKMAGRELTAEVAGRILEKYNPIDDVSKSTRDHWKNAASSMQYAFQCQAVADIAQMAGKTETATDLNDRALEVLSALMKMGKVKKAGLVLDSDVAISIDSLFTNEELSDPDIITELAYTGANLTARGVEDASPAAVILQAKKMTKAGNSELAREVLKDNLKVLSEDDFEKILVDGPEQIQGWDPLVLLNTLVESTAYSEADRLAKFLLSRNPTSIAANQAAAAASEGMGNYSDALVHLETLSALEPGSFDVKRKLANANLKVGSIESAYDIYRKMIDQADLVEEKDLCLFGDIALKLGKNDEALGAATEVLGRNPESAKGLTLAGVAHHRKGQIEAAVEEFKKAITISDGDEKPWIELAEINWSGGDHASALMTLKEGLSANPGNNALQSVYAQKLMEEGLVSEAFPYLLELSVKVSDPAIDLLMVAAMKHLGMENIDESLEGFIDKYPDEYRFKGEYGTRLVWGGETERGFGYLRQIADHLPEDPAWSLAYVEALLKPDYLPLAPMEKIQKADLSLTRDLLEGVLVREPENLRAKLLKAEWLLQTEDYPTARKLFDEIMDESQGGRDLPPARLYTGLAQSAAKTGEHEIAMAALDQAISIEPEWHGLKRLKAEFHQLMGEVEAAEKIGLMALELANEDAENHIWLIEFVTALGRTGQIDKLTNEAVEKFPDHLGLRLIQAQNRLGVATAEENLAIEQKLLSLIDNTEDPGRLIKAAVVFAVLDNQEKTIACLERAAACGSLEAQFSLAGLLRMRREHEKALDALNAIQPSCGLIHLLRQETEFDQTGSIKLADDQPDTQLDLPIGTIEEKFLPEAWKEIIESSNPAMVLRTRVAMCVGEPLELMDSVCAWVNADPGNVEARIYAIEIALACQAEEDYQRFLELDPIENQNKLASHFNLLKSELLLDTNMLVRNDPMETELFETMGVSEPEKLSAIRLLALDGNLHEAETTFEMAISVFTDTANLPYIVRLGILRNLAKSAAALDRWREALELSTRGIRIAANNAGFQVLHLKNQASGLEMKNRAEGFGIEQHCEKDDAKFTSIDMSTQFPNGIEEGSGELYHWMLRFQLAREPKRENIRALALLTPTDDDAAALMTGLRRIGQQKTAIQVAKKFADHPLVSLELAMCTAENDPQKAAEILERSLLVHPVQPLALRLRSALLEQAANLAEAAESLEQAIDLWPNEFRWHEKAAELWQGLGNTEKPVEHLRLAVLYASGDSSTQEKLGKALLSTSQPDEALKHLLAAVEKQPERYELWQSISEAHQQSGDLNLAMEAAERAVQVDPFAVKARLQASKVRWTRGELEKALDQVNLAISLDAEDAENYVFMAKLLLEQGDREKALHMLEKATQSKNADVRTMVEHASLLKNIKGAAAARDLIAAFSEKYPQNPELLRLLAEAEDQCGNLKKAEMVAKKALDLHPQQADLQMLLGKIQEKVGNLDQAVNYFSQAIALEPRRKDGYVNLSQVYLKQRDHVKARKVLEQGIEKMPDEIGLYLSCASLLKDAKDYHAAEKMLRNASALDPRNVNIHRQLGAVLALNLVHQSQEVSSQP